MSTTAVNAGYRQRVLSLRAATYRDLLRIWPAFNPDDPEAVAAWHAGASAVVRRDFDRQAGLAADYLTAHAFAAGTRPGQVVIAEPLPGEQVDTSLRVTSLVAYRKARGAGQTAQEALQTAYVRSAGAATRLTLTGGRSLIMRTTTRGERYVGWRRTGNPQCQFCRDLIGRGAVYREETATFDAHDHCACSAEPAYR